MYSVGAKQHEPCVYSTKKMPAIQYDISMWNNQFNYQATCSLVQINQAYAFTQIPLIV